MRHPSLAESKQAIAAWREHGGIALAELDVDHRVDLHAEGNAVFNAARSAIQHNPLMKTFYQRLVGPNRRPGKVALIAVMRRMLVILNAIARQNKPWTGANQPA